MPLRSYSLFFFLLLADVSFAQTFCLKGKVLDKADGKAIAQALIIVDQTDKHVYSDSTGAFKFTDIPPGSLELEFEKAGYGKLIKKVMIDGKDTAEVIFTMTAKAVDLAEVAVAADRPVSAASSAFISQSSFANRPKNSAQDLLRLVPGLFIAQHAGGGKAEQIFIRGFDCDHGTDIANYVDGIPVNMPSHGHGQGYSDLHFLIPEVVEGMSVFKGTSSPLYGDFATGAAVNFKTLDSISQNVLQLEGATVPSVGAVTASRMLAMMNLPISSSKLNSYFAVDLNNNRGYFDLPQDFKRFNLFSKTSYEINENSRVQFSASGFGSSWNASGQIPERAVNSGAISRYGSIDSMEGGTTQRNNYNLIYSAKLGSGNFQAQAYFCSYRFRLFSDFTFFLEDTVRGDMIEQDDERSIQGLNVNYSIGHQLQKVYSKFTLGASFRSDEIDNQLWHAPQRIRDNAFALATTHERSSGIFVNEALHFNDHFRVELGLRYDYLLFDVEDKIPTDSLHSNYSGFNYQSGLHPKVNVIYSLNERIHLFLNGGSGFHSNDARSSVQETGQHQLPLAVSAELGSLINIRHAVFSVAFWGMDVSNELVYVGDDGTTENRGASRRYGIDLSGRIQLNRWLNMDVDVNASKSVFIDTLFGFRLDSNYYIPLAPVLTSSGGFTAKFKNGFECSLRYRYMRDRPANENNTVVAHGYQVIDLTANYRFRHVKIGCVIENLLNTDWNEAQFDTVSKLKNESSAVEEIHFTAGTPFSCKLTLAYLF